MRARSPLVATALLAGLSLVVLAQQPPPAPNLAPWAPKWRKGDWWVVKTYQRDLRDRTRSSEPAEGAEPRVPPGVGTDPLPGFPPLRDGVPEGWKPANTFRFEVLRRELVRYPDDGPNDPPEAFWVVGARTTEGEPRTAEVWYTESDLTLFKVVLEPGGEEPRTRELSGKVQLDPAVSAELGFPLDWPDFVAAAKPMAELEVEGRGTVEQRWRHERQDIQVRLATKEGDKVRPRVLMTFRPGAPFWVRLVGPLYLAELTQQGQAGR